MGINRYTIGTSSTTPITNVPTSTTTAPFSGNTYRGRGGVYSQRGGIHLSDYTSSNIVNHDRSGADEEVRFQLID